MDLTHFDVFGTRLRESMIAHSWKPGSSSDSDDAFNELALVLFELQFTSCPSYRSFCAARGAFPGRIGSWTDIPAVPAAAFKELDLSCLPPADRTTVFHSSGTSEHRPSRHCHNADSLSIYESFLLPWFQVHFFPGSDLLSPPSSAGDRPEHARWDLAILTPRRAQAPHSSLVYMFDTIRRAVGLE
ncbi:MAG TPA: hypothetical protein VJA21_27545, partial [Verrucomicrobiae bacterium]